MGNLTFQEKGLWLMFVSLIGVFGSYFAAVWPSHSPDVQPEQIARFVMVVVWLVVLQVVGYILIALVDRRTLTDERDRMIGLRGARNGGFVLAAGAFFALCAAVMTRGNFLFTHVLLAFWVLAQLVEIASQLTLYRRGA